MVRLLLGDGVCEEGYPRIHRGRLLDPLLFADDVPVCFVNLFVFDHGVVPDSHNDFLHPHGQLQRDQVDRAHVSHDAVHDGRP